MRNPMKKVILSLSLIFGITCLAQAQFEGLGKILIDKGSELAGGSLNKIIKQPAAITTNFKDVQRDGKKPPSFHEGETAQPLYLLPKAPEGGFKYAPAITR